MDTIQEPQSKLPLLDNHLGHHYRMMIQNDKKFHDGTNKERKMSYDDLYKC